MTRLDWLKEKAQIWYRKRRAEKTLEDLDNPELGDMNPALFDIEVNLDLTMPPPRKILDGATEARRLKMEGITSRLNAKAKSYTTREGRRDPLTKVYPNIGVSGRKENE